MANSASFERWQPNHLLNMPTLIHTVSLATLSNLSHLITGERGRGATELPEATAPPSEVVNPCFSTCLQLAALGIRG